MFSTKIFFFTFFCLILKITCFQGINFDQCTNSTYKSTGEFCSKIQNEHCKVFNVCKNNKCKEAKIGDECEKDVDCYLSRGTEQSITCIKNKCSKRRYNGESCDVNEQVNKNLIEMFKLFFLKCFSGICIGNFCKGKGKGEICDSTKLVECDSGLFCSKITNACIPQLEENEDCHDHVDNSIKDPRQLPEGSNFMIMCKGGFMCMGDTKQRKCRPFRGGSIGSYCDFSMNRHYECEFGLQCDKISKKCIDHGVSD